MAPANPAEDWQALTANYRSMGDLELEDLALGLGDLTPTAQQALADEMRLRGLGDPRSPGWSAAAASPHAQADEPPEFASAVEYTWKTPLCVCAGREEARQVAEVLDRAGIESWLDSGALRLLVAADQLDEARAILDRPISQEIVEHSQVAIPEYEPPVCPRCGAVDPILESADPVNAWKCESCGAEWAEESPETGEQDVNDQK